MLITFVIITMLNESLYQLHLYCRFFLTHWPGIGRHVIVI